MEQCDTKGRENSRDLRVLPTSERRAPALRVTGASLSRGAGAPRSGRQRAGVRAGVSSNLIFGVDVS